jgi:hypothetical protein
LIAALLFAVAAVAQQHAASKVDEGEDLLRSLVRNPRWWAGLLGDAGGYAFQVAALAFGSVLVVQPILVSSLIFALPMAAHYAGRRIGRRTWATAAALALALAAFMIVGDPSAGRPDAPFRDWLGPLVLVLALVAIIVAVAWRAREPGRRALLLGTAGGGLFGLSAALTEHVTDLLSHLDHGPGPLLTSWQVYSLAAAGIGGLYLQQVAFHAGSLTASLPAVMIAEPLVAAFCGMAAMRERLHTGPIGIGLTFLAVAIMCWSAVVLSRAAADAAPVVSAGAVPARTDSAV